MKRARRSVGNQAPAYCRWIDIVGRNPAHLAQVQKRLALPPRLAALSRADYLYPTVIPVQEAWFVFTFFTIPSRRGVFARQPLCLWRAPYALVTISPWARGASLLKATGERSETRDDFLCRVLEAAVNSHEEVARRLDEAFFAHDDGLNPYAWHHKERRVALFTRLLTHQLDILCTVGLENARVQRLHEQLAGLVEIARYAERKLRDSGYCQLCSRPARSRSACPA